MAIVALPPKVLAARALPSADQSLLHALGVDELRLPCLGLLTCDQDDSLYVALDHATKHADVEVVFARSFYAGSSHASGPLSGEILGILGAHDAQSIEDGLYAALTALEEEICFYQVDGGGTTFFPHVIGETGRYLSAEAGIEPGMPMAYLVAPPLESMIGLDAALKAAHVRLLKHFAPPTPTNFGCAYLTGELSALEASARAFTDAILDVAACPLKALRRSIEQRR